MALTARGSSSICHHAWEREEVLCGATQEVFRAKVSLFQLLSMLPAEGFPENSLSALFRAEKVRLSVALAGLRESDHWLSAQDLHREEQRGMGNVRLLLIENQGLGAGRNFHSQRTPATDEKWSLGRKRHSPMPRAPACPEPGSLRLWASAWHPCRLDTLLHQSCLCRLAPQSSNVHASVSPSRRADSFPNSSSTSIQLPGSLPPTLLPVSPL